MANIWRRQPTQRLQTRNLINYGGQDASVAIANEFFEAFFEVVGTNMKININDVWKDVDSLKINIGDVWKDVVGAYINIGGTWKTIF